MRKYVCIYVYMNVYIYIHIQISLRTEVFSATWWQGSGAIPLPGHLSVGASVMVGFMLSVNSVLRLLSC